MNGSIEKDCVESTGMRGTETFVAVGVADEIRFWRLFGSSDGVFVPARGVAFVIVFLPLSQHADVEPLICYDHGLGRSVGNFLQPDRFALPNGPRSFEVAGRVVA